MQHANNKRVENLWPYGWKYISTFFAELITIKLSNKVEQINTNLVIQVEMF